MSNLWLDIFMHSTFHIFGLRIIFCNYWSINGGLTHIHIFGTLYLSQPFCSVYFKVMVALIITFCMFYERFNMAVVRWASWVMAQKSVLRYFGLYMQHYTLHRTPQLKIFQVLIASRHVLARQSSLLCKAMMTRMDSEKT